MLETAEFATKFIVSPQKNQGIVNPPSLILREREREEQMYRIDRRNSKGASRRTAVETALPNSCLQSLQFPEGLGEAGALKDKETLALAAMTGQVISLSNKTEGGRRNDRLISNG